MVGLGYPAPPPPASALSATPPPPPACSSTVTPPLVGPPPPKTVRAPRSLNLSFEGLLLPLPALFFSFLLSAVAGSTERKKGPGT